MKQMEMILRSTYSVKHQCMKGQTKCQQQEDEQDEDTYECLYDFAKHYNINTKTFKPVRKIHTQIV